MYVCVCFFFSCSFCKMALNAAKAEKPYPQCDTQGDESKVDFALGTKVNPFVDDTHCW